MSTKKKTSHTVFYLSSQIQKSHSCLNFSLQPFTDGRQEDQTGFLTLLSKSEARAIVEARLGTKDDSASPPVEGIKEKRSNESKMEQDEEEENETNPLMEESEGSSDVMVGVNELKRKSIFNFLQPPAKSRKTSELDVYLSEPLLESNSSLLFWKSAARFPQLQSIAKKLLAVPATSGGFHRLYPMAACIVRAKRNCLPPHTTERLLLYKNSLKTKTVRKSSGVTKS